MMKTNERVMRDVMEEFAWQPSIASRDLAVDAERGVLTLRGTVSSLREHDDVLAAAGRVRGVTALADELEVVLPAANQFPDSELAVAVVDALRWNAAVPPDRITVVVRDGTVTLSGNVDWRYQREAACRAVRQLIGVKRLVDAVAVTSPPRSADVRTGIEAALRRYAEEDAKNIRVETHDSEVVLRGSVPAAAERERAERAAWAAPGVESVRNEIVIVPT
jgi:osmotically-inducible protein OsmY